MDELRQDIRDLRQDLRDCSKEIADTRVQMANLKGRASVWGLFAGLIASLVVAWFGRS